MADNKERVSRISRWEWAALAVILLAATFLRLYQLDTLPPGLTHDEAGHGHDAVAIAQGARPIYQTVGYGREPLYDYLAAGLIALGSPTVIALRLVSVMAGLATLLLTFAWVHRAIDGPTALLATALQAASFWSLAVSRQALRSSLLPALFTGALYLFWHAVYAPPHWTWRQRGAVLALFAALLGATLYTYIPARVLWLLFPAFLLYLALYHRPVCRRVAVPALIAICAGLLLSAPMFLFLRAHPSIEQRLAMLDAPLRAFAAGDVSAILERATGYLAAFVLPGWGDDFLAYNLPGRPFLNPVTGGLFVIGLVICLARARHPAYAMALLWFAVAISPSLVTGATASMTRSIAALPVTFLFPAIAAVTGTRQAASRWGNRVHPIAGGILAALVITSGALAVRDYLAWSDLPPTRAAYMHTLTQTAQYLDATPDARTVGLSTALPLAPHDPYVFEARLRRSDLVTRWFDGRSALIVPSTSAAHFVVPALAPLDPYFADLPGLMFRERVSMRPDDLNPFFDVYAWETRATRDALLHRAQGTPLEPALPVDLDGILRLRGYDLRPPTVTPGAQIMLVTVWEVIASTRGDSQDPLSAEHDLVFFTHILDPAGNVAGQADRLDAPAWSWQPGDLIAQIHQVTLADVPPGSLEMVIGAYRRADMTRLPARVNGESVGDLIRLPPLDVRAP